MKVRLSELIETLDMQNEESYSVYDTLTGKLYTVWDGMVNGEDNPELIEEIEDNEAYLPLPDQYDLHEYEIMRAFIYSLSPGRLQDRLFRAISGRGAFRRFKDTLLDDGKIDRWYEYREASIEKIARDWANRNEVEIIEDIPSKLYILEDEEEEWEPDYEAAQQYWVEKDQKAGRMKVNRLKEQIEAFIQAHNTCALATGADDFVRCTPIEYNYVNGAFYLFSEGGLKFRALRDNKNVCLAIFDAYTGFGKLGGLQVMGTAELIQPFTQEYNEILAWKKISQEAMKKLPSPMNLIKVTPVEMDYLNSELKKEGYRSRQHLKL